MGKLAWEELLPFFYFRGLTSSSSFKETHFSLSSLMRKGNPSAYDFEATKRDEGIERVVEQLFPCSCMLAL